MSILLEALKKSEQERQLGQPPTLQTHSAEGTSGRETLNPWIVLSLAVVSACVMAWFGWQQFDIERQDVGVAVQASEAAISGEAGLAGTSADNLQEEAPPVRTMNDLYQKNRHRSARSENPQSGNRADAQDDRTRLANSVSSFTADSDPASAVTPIESEPAVAAVQTAPPAVTPAPDANATGQPKKPEQRTGLEPHVSEPISYWELPQGIRDNLPQIKITVLVYAEQPDDRFLLSNGQRLVEKEELDGGLVLDEIRKDGAVFLFRNYRFLVKR